MISKKTWITTFLSITGLAIAFEIFAVTNPNDNFIPWTQMIVENIPYELTFLVIFGLGGWLIVHFLRWYGIIKQK